MITIGIADFVWSRTAKLVDNPISYVATETQAEVSIVVCRVNLFHSVMLELFSSDVTKRYEQIVVWLVPLFVNGLMLLHATYVTYFRVLVILTLFTIILVSMIDVDYFKVIIVRISHIFISIGILVLVSTLRKVEILFLNPISEIIIIFQVFVLIYDRKNIKTNRIPLIG